MCVFTSVASLGLG